MAESPGISTVSAQAASREESVGTGAVAISMFCVLLLAYVLMAADRYLFPVLAVDVRKDFGLSLSSAGLLSTIFTLGLGVGGLPTGFLLHRLSRKSVLLTGIAIFSAATALTTVSGGFWGLLFCLAAQGIGMAMLATSIFTLAASYFARYRAAAIGSVNVCYGLGGFFGPIIATALLTAYGTWHAPMVAFGAFGFVMIGAIALAVRKWFSEVVPTSQVRSDAEGAASLANRNTVILTVLCMIHGLSMYGFLGMYPTFLRDSLHYTPKLAGFVVSFFGVGALASIAGGWLGDRLSPRFSLSAAFACVAVLGYFFFQPSPSALTREILTCIYGVVGSAVLYVNLAGYHVKSLRASLASRGSGMFVTSLYGAAAFSGYIIGAITGHVGWLMAGEIQMTLLCVIGAVLSLALRTNEMST